MDDRDLENELTDLAIVIVRDSPTMPWQAWVDVGAALRGVSREQVENWAVTMFDAGDVVLDQSVEPWRREVCRRIAFGAMDTLNALADAGRARLEARAPCAS